MDTGEEKSKTTEKEVILLGLVAEGPIHAYGLEEKIRTRQMDIWTSIGFSSIYRVLTRLEKKGFIDTHLEHEGQGATRKVHSITRKGSRALAEGVLEHLGRVVPVKSAFSVGLANITQAPLDEVCEQLTLRRQDLNKNQLELKEMEKQMLEMLSRLPPSASSTAYRAQLTVQLVFACARAHIEAEHGFVTHGLERLQLENADMFGPDSAIGSEQEES